MKSTSNESPAGSEGDAPADKPSRAAEYIAALYVALVLLTPWLLRDASLLAPPSTGVEIQMSNKAAPAPALVTLPDAPANIRVRAN